MFRIDRVKWMAGGAAFALAFAGAGVIAQTAASDDAKAGQDRAKIEKEMQDLQEQRAKLDSRIRELRRQAGREDSRPYILGEGGKLRVLTAPGTSVYSFSDGKLKDMKELTPEQRKKVEEAISEAKRAIEKARKELPEGFVMPDVESLLDNTLRFRMLQPGAIYAPRAFDSKEFREQMEKMRDTIRKNVETQRNLVIPAVPPVPGTTVLPTPRVYTVPRTRATPAIPATPFFRDANPELRNEMRELRRELEQLREEIRRDRGGKKESEDRKSRFTEPFGEIG